MNKNQVLQIKKSPTPRQWNGGTVHTIGACTTTTKRKGALFMIQKILPMFECTMQEVNTQQTEVKLRSDAISKEIQSWGKKKATPSLIGQSRKIPIEKRD